MATGFFTELYQSAVGPCLANDELPDEAVAQEVTKILARP
jgi:hypothetical protein